MGCVGCSLLTTTSISLAIFFNHKALIFLREAKFHKDEGLAFRGIQKTMIVQLISHCVMLSIPIIGLIISSLFEFPYLILFISIMECGPTVTTIVTLITVPEYRKRLKLFFSKMIRR